MIRSIVAVIAGYFVSTASVVLVFVLVGILAPEALNEEEARIEQPWMNVVIAGGFLGAVAGGWACAKVANLLGRQSPFAHVLALGMLTLALWMVTMITAPPEQSTAYQIALNLTGVGGLLLGGWVWSWRARKLGN